jgi:flagellar protein FliO/FliZ
MPCLVRATEVGGSPGASAVVGPREIINTGLSLLLIVAAIMALAWAYTRLQGGRARNGDVIRIVAAQPLGAKERVMLVDVAGQHLLIGVTASQIRTLHVLEEPVAAARAPAESAGFAGKLRGIVHGTAR